MPKSRKPARKYDERRFWRKLGAAIEQRDDRKPLRDGPARDMSLAAHLSLEQLCRNPDECSWSNLACTCNLSMILAEHGYGDEQCLSFVRAAQDALRRTEARAKVTGQWSMDGDGIVALREVLALHDAQIEQASRSEIRQALVEMSERLEREEALERGTAA